MTNTKDSGSIAFFALANFVSYLEMSCLLGQSHLFCSDCVCV